MRVGLWSSNNLALLRIGTWTTASGGRMMTHGSQHASLGVVCHADAAKLNSSGRSEVRCHKRRSEGEALLLAENPTVWALHTRSGVLRHFLIGRAFSREGAHLLFVQVTCR